MARGNTRAAPAADEAQVIVRLVEPTKVHGKRCEPDTVVTVPASLAADLVASGAGLLGEGATPPAGEPQAPAGGDVQGDLVDAAGDGTDAATS